MNINNNLGKIGFKMHHKETIGYLDREREKHKNDKYQRKK